MSWTTGKITTATTEGGKDKNYNKILAQMLLKECSNVDLSETDLKIKDEFDASTDITSKTNPTSPEITECPIVTVMILLKVG